MFEKLFGGGPQTQGSLAAIAQILQASGPSRTPRGLYQILGSGLAAGQDATQKSQEHEMDSQLANIRMQDLQSETAARLRKQGDADRLVKFYSGGGSAGAPPVSMPAPAGMEQGGMPSQLPPVGAMGVRPGASTSTGTNATGGWFEKQIERAEQLYAAGLPDEAARVEKQALAFRGQAKWENVKTKDGKVSPMPLYGDGTRGETVDADVARDLDFRNIGPKTVGFDSVFGNVVSSTQNGMSPDAVASNAVSRGNLEVSRQRLNMDREKDAREKQGGTGQKPPQGYRWAPDGSLEAIPGGPATKHATATEGERKASTLLQRMEGAQQQMQAALTEKPTANEAGLVSKGLRSVGADALANTVATSSERQRVEAAELDFLDAGLTLGTGAAYTREQLDSYRKSYFPQIGDSEATIKDKSVRRERLTQAAKTAAGRAVVPAGDAGPKADFSKIPPKAAAHLKMKPALRAEFDAKFGAGAAAYVLGK